MGNTEICAALFEAFASGDGERVRALSVPDLQASQNGGPSMDLESLLTFSDAVQRVVKHFRYEDARRSATATGFVEEHNVRGVLPDGSQLNLPVCVVGDVRDGRVSALREYLDFRAAAGLVAALSRTG